MDTDDLLTTSACARRIGISVASLRRWCDAGKGPPHWRTPGGQRRFSRARVDEWVAERETQAQEAAQ